MEIVSIGTTCSATPLTTPVSLLFCQPKTKRPAAKTTTITIKILFILDINLNLLNYWFNYSINRQKSKNPSKSEVFCIFIFLSYMPAMIIIDPLNINDKFDILKGGKRKSKE
jgi:hypothetical protein